MGRANSQTDGLGTTTTTTYDALGRVTSVAVGGTTVETDVYDNGGVGDSNLTRQTEITGGSQPDRVTTNSFDWRDRQVASSNGVSIDYETLDNLGEATSMAVYDASVSSVGPVRRQRADQRRQRPARDDQ